MTTDNYFKTFDGGVFFFSSRNKESITRAYELVLSLDPFPSVWKPVRRSGKWDGVSLIGHRALGVILRDIDTETDPKEMARLDRELNLLQARYTDIDRSMPLCAVAA